MRGKNSPSDGGTRGWQKFLRSGEGTPPDYRWQSDGIAAASKRTNREILRSRLRLLGLATVIACVSALFLVELLYSQTRTLVIAVAPFNYAIPYLPLSWSQEDVEAFRFLDGNTLNLQVIAPVWKTKDQVLRQIDRELSKATRSANRSTTIVVYLRMHSNVDSDGTPCLVPPGASPFDSKSWVPIQDLLERFRLSSDKVNKLLILDCHDVLASWNQGIIVNTFALRLPQAVSASAISNLTVLSAAGPFEVAATSQELRHGVFGHFLLRGLSGDADSSGGNSDGVVSVRELYDYVFEHVNGWSIVNRGRTQQPQLISANTNDFTVVAASNRRTRMRDVVNSRSVSPGSASVSTDQIASLWSQFQDFQSHLPFRFDPVKWTRIEQQICWLEAAAESGVAYRQSSDDLYETVRNDFKSLKTVTEENRRRQSHLKNWTIVSGKPLPRSEKLNTVPIARLFGNFETVTEETFKAILDPFKKAPSSGNLQNAINPLLANEKLSHLELTTLLRIWQKYEVVQLWPNPAFLASVIELHEIADAASFPADERTLDWIRGHLETADARRRTFDDLAFVGGNVSEADLVETRQHFENASRLAEKVSHAYDIRDQLAHELPYLAQWLTRPPVDDPGSSHQEQTAPWIESFKRDLALLLDLSGNLQSLERALREPTIPERNEWVELPFQELLNKIVKQREQLLGRISTEYERLNSSEEARPTTWNDIQGLLKMPLLPATHPIHGSSAEQRKRLREKHDQHGRKLADLFDSQSHNSSKTASGKEERTAKRMESDKMPQFLEEMLIGEANNLGLTVVNRERDDAGKTNESKRPQVSSAYRKFEIIAEAEGAAFRDYLKTQSEKLPDSSDPALRLNADREKEKPLADANFRAAASVARLEKNDPVEVRRRSDLQRMLLWQSRRVLEDFWGPATSEEASYFDVTTTNLMTLAKRVDRETSAETEAINADLKKYRMAAVDGLETAADNLLIEDDSEPIVAKIAVYPNRNQETKLPRGIGAVFIRDRMDHRMTAPERLQIPWPNAAGLESAQFDLTLNDVDYNRQSIQLKAVTSFRGHDYVGDLYANSIEGVLIDYQPHTDRESHIAIRGRKTRKMSIVFVLDCSNSMGQDLPLEADNRAGSRLEIAKSALQSMLDRLADDENHRVGVVCFGHRIGWDLKQAGQLLRQKDYRGSFPDQIRPYDDVETVLELGRFDASFAEKVTEQLASVKPWGESPLHLALIQALKQFDHDEADTDQSIVVITDGINNQFNPPEIASKSLEDVFAAWKLHPVPIHIIGMGIGASEAATAQREFADVAKRTNGSFVSAQQARELVDSLEKFHQLNGIRRFQVHGQSDGSDQEAEVGRTIVVETQPRQRNDFEVSLGSAVEIFTLFGGETLELLPTRVGRRFDVPAYEIGQPKFVPFLRSDGRNSATELIAGIHRPLRRGSTVTFEISIQNPQRQFVSRPVEVWIEIEPIIRLGRQTPQKYVFYDTHFLSETSVPISQWTVSDWPAEAKQARIQMWHKIKASAPFSKVLLSDVMNQDRDPDVALDGVTGVMTRIRVRQNNPLQISIVERHSQTSAGVGTLKLGLKSEATPLRVRHRFDSRNRVATHLYEFSKQDDKVLHDGQIQWTTRTEAQAEAWRTAEAVVVDVAETGDLYE